MENSNNGTPLLSNRPYGSNVSPSYQKGLVCKLAGTAKGGLNTSLGFIEKGTTSYLSGRWRSRLIGVVQKFVFVFGFGEGYNHARTQAAWPRGIGNHYTKNQESIMTEEKTFEDKVRDAIEEIRPMLQADGGA